MSSLGHGIGCGVVFGIVVVLLGQQFGLFELSSLWGSLTDLLLGALVGGLLFGVIGYQLGRRAAARSAPGVAEPGSAKPS